MNDFNRTRCIIVLLLSTAVLGVAQMPETNRVDSLSSDGVRFSSLAKSLMLQARDFRREFFADRKMFETVKREGLFLLTYGSANNTRKISTNDCATVEATLNKYGGDVSNIQIRIVEQDAIIQTPVPKGENMEAVNALLGLRLHPGDVVILTLME